MKKALTEITELVRRETGIVLPAARQTSLRAALRRTAPDLDSSALVCALSNPAGGRDLINRLIDEVTIQETTFVRDRGQLDGIGWHNILQGAREAGSHQVRVWSAGCATGEEPYTLALLAAEAFAPVQAPVDVLGTDISGAALAAAAAGHYRERAVHALDTPLRSRYLERQADGSYLVGERLRKLVRFRRHNLVKDSIPPAGEAGFDLILCRNVLIYFQQSRASYVIEALDRALRPGGVLILGAADALQRRAGQPTTDAIQRPAGWPPSRSAASGRMATPPASASARTPGAVRAGHRPPRRPLGRKPVSAREQRLATALDAADTGDRNRALAHVGAVLAVDPLDADAHFVQGMVALEAGEPARAVAALRRALYTDAAFTLAAFTLGRAYDMLGDGLAARRAYARALRTLDPEDHRHELILRQVDIGDIAAACRARLRGGT